MNGCQCPHSKLYLGKKRRGALISTDKNITRASLISTGKNMARGGLITTGKNITRSDLGHLQMVALRLNGYGSYDITALHDACTFIMYVCMYVCMSVCTYACVPNVHVVPELGLTTQA